MHCKDCRYFKKWYSFHTAFCEKLNQSIAPDSRPCDEFISRLSLVNEWGESLTNRSDCEYNN
ncbi:hypothetical protein [Desulfolucanica intricata]|uniref:hypothetical protein n=1 Tax=Desulfolucanica intricata TaxID=1285191 RepID=UPI0008305FD1|nr:hypothetical protein [Desulfolucanica intricata]